MLGEATLDVLGTFLGEAIRFPIQIAALHFCPKTLRTTETFRPRQYRRTRHALFKGFGDNLFVEKLAMVTVLLTHEDTQENGVDSCAHL